MLACLASVSVFACFCGQKSGNGRLAERMAGSMARAPPAPAWANSITNVSSYCREVTFTTATTVPPAAEAGGGGLVRIGYTSSQPRPPSASCHVFNSSCQSTFPRRVRGRVATGAVGGSQQAKDSFLISAMCLTEYPDKPPWSTHSQ